MYDPEILYKYSRNMPEYVGVKLSSFRKKSLEEQWRHEYIIPEVWAQASRDYVLRFKPELEKNLDFSSGWERSWWEHLYNFTGASAVMLYYSMSENNN